METIADIRVWRSVKALYIGSGVLFLVNISLGLLNVLTDGVIPHHQGLAHFHAGTIGWVTLSVIATGIWAFTGQRQVSNGYSVVTALIASVGIVAVGGYILAFWFAFGDGGHFSLLPVFGVPAALVIVTSFILVATQMKHQVALTSTHILFFGALLIASLGASMGVWWGLHLAHDIGYGNSPDVGPHAAPMDMYLLLAFAGIVEHFVRKDRDEPRTKPAIAQVSLAVVAAFAASGALLANKPDLAGPTFLLWLISFGFYMVRSGWRTFTINPAGPGSSANRFFGGLFLPVYVLGFVFLVFAYFIPEKDIPHALEITFAHVAFVGMATNLLLAMHSHFTEGSPLYAKAEPIGGWLLNIGLILFIAGEWLAESGTDVAFNGRWGALVMAAGVLMSLFIVLTRTLLTRDATADA